jgi:protein farnesyltransferase/geranylgeranyltransferase type-1 subunit alpha
LIRQHRRECIKKLELDLNQELVFMDSFAEENPKNYQIWFVFLLSFYLSHLFHHQLDFFFRYHRRAIIEQLPNLDQSATIAIVDRELVFTEKVFEIDAKNYHAWAHR